MISLKTILPYYISIVIILVFIFLLIKYVYNVEKQTKYFRYTLILLRFITLLLLLIILFNPSITITDEIVKNKKIVFFIDNSKSIPYSLNKFNLIEELENIDNHLTKEGIEIEYYVFGDSLKKINSISKLTFTDVSTDFNEVIRNINKIDANQYILISDGMQNEGMIRKIINLSNPIYSFGIGNHNEIFEDLKLDSLNIFHDTEDSVYIKCQISTNLMNDYDNIEISLSNQNYNNLKISSINIKSGQNIVFHNMRIKKDILENNNVINIESIKSEINSSNNYLTFELDDKILKKTKTLLISGRLSNNTKFIKQLLYSHENIDFNHVFKQDDILKFKSQYYDFIIFDSFPINNNQLKIIDDVNFKVEKFAYFQGPVLSDDSYICNTFLSSLGYSIDIIVGGKGEMQDIYTEITSDNDIVQEFINGITPFTSNFLVRKKNNSSIMESIVNKQDKESILLDYSNDSLFIFITDLKNISSETKRFNDEDNLTHLIDYYIDRLLNNQNMLNVYTDKSHFYVGENINLYLNIDSKNYFKNYRLDLFIYDKNHNIVSKINEFDLINDNLYKYSTTLDESQKYYIQAVMKNNNSVLIESNEIEFNVFDIDKELHSIGLNDEVLRKISFDTKGEYYSINQLFDYIKEINQSQLTTFKLNRIDIFNFQPFWFIILLLMILEWIIRKNKGLL